jgi:hypothetical protein
MGHPVCYWLSNGGDVWWMLTVQNILNHCNSAEETELFQYLYHVWFNNKCADSGFWVAKTLKSHVLNMLQACNFWFGFFTESNGGK